MTTSINLRSKPKEFLKKITVDVFSIPGLVGLTGSFRNGDWDTDGFANGLLSWLLEFALKGSAYEKTKKRMANGDFERLVKNAARRIYTTPKYQNRGEFGELLLHAAMRQVFNTQPAISKIYYKTATNDTVKGFDAVHVVEKGKELELWLGETKFYSDFKRAVRNVLEEIELHTRRNYLEDEFVLISDKIEDSWEHSKKLRKLLSINDKIKLSEVFDSVCFPILLTYNSVAIEEHKGCNFPKCNKNKCATCVIAPSFVEAIETEIRENHNHFLSKCKFKKLKIYVFIVPIKSKSDLITNLDTKLKSWQ
jgi:hypothetical protein